MILSFILNFEKPSLTLSSWTLLFLCSSRTSLRFPFSLLIYLSSSSYPLNISLPYNFILGLSFFLKLDVLYMLSHSIFQLSYYSHFADEVTKARVLSNLYEATQCPNQDSNPCSRVLQFSLTPSFSSHSRTNQPPNPINSPLKISCKSDHISVFLSHSLS